MRPLLIGGNSFFPPDGWKGKKKRKKEVQQSVRVAVEMDFKRWCEFFFLFFCLGLSEGLSYEVVAPQSLMQIQTPCCCYKDTLTLIHFLLAGINHQRFVCFFCLRLRKKYFLMKPHLILKVPYSANFHSLVFSNNNLCFLFPVSQLSRNEKGPSFAAFA